MKIAFLTHSVFSDGGVQRVVTTIANNLCKNYSVDIICTNTKTMENRSKYGLSNEINIVFNNINKCSYSKEIILRAFRLLNRKTGIFNNKYLFKFLTRIYYPKYQRKNIINLIDDKGYDLVIGCEGYYALLMGVIKKDTSARVFSWQHNSYEVYLESKNKYYWNEDILFTKLLKNVERNIVLTKHDKRLFEENLGVKSITIYNPLSFKCEKKSTQNKKVILCAGRIEYRKGMDLLLKAFAKIENKDGWKINIIGNGEMEKELRELALKLHINDLINFIPFNSNIKEYMINSSIYAMSSRGEGFGLVVTEALEAGLPVVSFKTTGPSEIIGTQKCGELVECFDIDKYSDALRNLMDDNNKRKKYSENAVIRAREFEVDKIIKEWEEIINFNEVKENEEVYK
ncbi:glycosyltransferase family 4 protein [Clostridium sp. CTA-17]